MSLLVCLIQSHVSVSLSHSAGLLLNSFVLEVFSFRQLPPYYVCVCSVCVYVCVCWAHIKLT